MLVSQANCCCVARSGTGACSEMLHLQQQQWCMQLYFALALLAHQQSHLFCFVFKGGDLCFEVFQCFRVMACAAPPPPPPPPGLHGPQHLDDYTSSDEDFFFGGGLKEFWFRV